MPKRKCNWRDWRAEGTFMPGRVPGVKARVGMTTGQRMKVGGGVWIMRRGLLVNQCSKRFAPKPKFQAWTIRENTAHKNRNLHLKMSSIVSQRIHNHRAS